jgi:threonine/homoserine/homoserine lactone efflux protein
VGVLLEQTLPDAVAAMLAAPLVLVVSILIMSTASRPMRNTLLFVAGAAVLDVCLAFLFLTLYGDVGLSSSSINYGAWIDTVVGVALLVFGIRAGLARRTPADSEAEDARFDKIARSNAKGLLLAGLAAQIINIDALVIMAGGMKEIALTNPLPTQLEIALAVLIFVYVMLVPYHLPVELRLVAPGRATAFMTGASGFLTRHAPILETVTGVVLGLLFLLKGLRALLS